MSIYQMTVAQLSDFYARWNQQGRDDAADGVELDYLAFCQVIAPDFDDDTRAEAWKQYKAGFLDYLGIIEIRQMANESGTPYGEEIIIRQDADEYAIQAQYIGYERLQRSDVWDQVWIHA